MGNDLISIDTGDFVLFQSTFPRGERRRETKKAMFGWAFQSTFPRGERRSLSCIFIHDELFQSTFPRGERRDSFNTAYNSTNFNPRSRVGNDVATFLPLYLIQISIHVPAWGTTMEELLHTRHFHISIHVPAWGTTQFAEQNINHFQFQSTFPRGERPFAQLFLLLGGLFQSTFPRGERLYHALLSDKSLRFQSTFPRGERRNQSYYQL